MKQNDLNKKFFNEEELPVSVPSTDLAWEQMQNRLEKEMPQKDKRKKRFIIFFLLLAFLAAPPILFYLNNNNNRFKQANSTKTILEKNRPPRKDTANIEVLHNSTSKKVNEKLQDQKNNNTAIVDDNTVARQNLSVQQDDDLKSVNKKSNDQRIILALDEKPTNAKHKKQKTNIHHRKKIGIDNQQNVPSTEPVEEVTNKSAVILSGKNMNAGITPGSTLTDLDSNSTILDKNNSVQINKITDSLDITISKEEKEARPAEEKAILKGGLQWNIQIPPSGAGNYFAGGNLKSQPYLLLVPGIWTSVQINRSLFSLEIHPYYSSLVPSKTYREFTSSKSTTDTVIIVTEQRQLNKLIGTAFNASFGYNIKDNWWLKGGLQMQWWRKGIATAGISEEKYPANNIAAKTFSSSSHVFPLENNEWDYFTKFQVNPNIEAIYMFKKWETSLRIGLPIVPIANSGDGPKNSFRTEFILRYQLFKK